ncbi:MAG: hypothetical protein J7J99_00335 [Thermoprotei archaeon]|nr:hypothetical protein [Thermoprotei archaeon]
MSGSDCYYVRRDKILNHFLLRYKQRGIDRIVDLDVLINMIEDAWRRGKFSRNRDGIEGFRFRVEIPYMNRRIIVVVEKTPKCLLPITLWSEKLL